jgi:hypothetical protein
MVHVRDLSLSKSNSLIRFVLLEIQRVLAPGGVVVLEFITNCKSDCETIQRVCREMDGHTEKTCDWDWDGRLSTTLDELGFTDTTSELFSWDLSREGCDNQNVSNLQRRHAFSHMLSAHGAKHQVVAKMLTEACFDIHKHGTNMEVLGKIYSFKKPMPAPKEVPIDEASKTQQGVPEMPRVVPPSELVPSTSPQPVTTALKWVEPSSPNLLEALKTIPAHELLGLLKATLQAVYSPVAETKMSEQPTQLKIPSNIQLTASPPISCENTDGGK